MRTFLAPLYLTVLVLAVPGSACRADALARLKPERLEAVHKAVQALDRKSVV